MLKEKMKEVNSKGLNIYMLLNKFKKDSKLKPEIPEEVVERVCDQYLRMGERINKSYPYFLKVLYMESSSYFSKKNSVKQKEEVNKTLLKNIFASL